jgi:CDP-diacylglycerol--glycerol-3-phosphate 3-phosphatidyltransferase
VAVPASNIPTAPQRLRGVFPPVPAGKPVAPAAPAAPPAARQTAPATVSAKPRLWNIANVLTVARLALVPVIVAVLVWDGGANVALRLVAAGLFTVAAVTDHLDGHLARARGLVTDFGKIADPIVDKALVLLTLAALCWIGGGNPSWWVFILITARELGVTVMRFAVVKYAVIPASTGGKLKTVVQIVAVGLYVLPLPWVWASWVAQIAMIVAVALTIATGVEYAFTTASIVSAARENPEASRHQREGGEPNHAVSL